jgi:L-amino acid N-acyltransferase YncA
MNLSYIGTGRNSDDVERALALATQVFRAADDVALVDIKRCLMSPVRALRPQDVIILIDASDVICATCFLVDRFFFRNGGKVKGTFLSSICVGDAWRGKGLSQILMDEAIAECVRRRSGFAILIARRAVDHFYTKFSFWGLSQYSKISLSFSDPNTVRNGLMEVASEGDLPEVNRLYESTYRNLYGACERTIDYWQHVIWKMKNQKTEFVVYKERGRVAGYTIFSGGDVYEFAAAGVPLLDVLRCIRRDSPLPKEMTLHCAPSHPIVRELENHDFSVTQRQCNYGGHMVRVIDEAVLMQCMKEELSAVGGVASHSETGPDGAIHFHDGKAEVILTGAPQSYRNTCLLMRAGYLSSMDDLSIYKQRPFNIPLADQV